MEGQTRVNKSISHQLSGAQNQFPTEWQSFYNNAEEAPRQVSPPQEAYLDVEPSQQGSLTKATEPPSSPSTTQNPVIGSPGLESVVSTGDKEVYNSVGYHAAHPPAVPPRKRICGLPKKWFLVAAGVATCVMVAIAIALGVVFGTRKSSYVTLREVMAMMIRLMVVLPSSHNPTSRPTDAAPPRPVATGPSPNSGDPDFSIGGALNTQYYSTAGAFNGTGLALASQSFGQGDRGEIVMYFQHWSGDLRWSQLMSDGSWQGGSASETLAQDAKNGTPISAVAYSMDKESIWHIFYIDLNNTVRERINSNTTNVWREGPLSKRNLKANRADQVGMQACWFGNFYGDSSFKKSDAFNAPNSDGLPNDQVGMRLWYASSDTTFEQLGWLRGEVSVYTLQLEYTSIDCGGSRMIGFLRARGRTKTVEPGSDAIPGVPAASPMSSWSTLTIPSRSGGGTQTQACPETSATPSTTGQIVRRFFFLPFSLSSPFSLSVSHTHSPARLSPSYYPPSTSATGFSLSP
jgi:hypothetical protein